MLLRPLLLATALLTAASLPSHAPRRAAQTKQVNPNAATMKAFTDRVGQYVALHKKLEATLPALPKQTTPQQMDAHERALAKLIQQARSTAKPGDLLIPSMQRLVRRLLAPVFVGRDGAQIEAEIMDKEYKGDVKLAVNGRYPDDVPVSTMPPQVLDSLPKLPEELEYRFIRHSLILFDPHAHIIPDWVPQAFK
jgi:hypothetical protein